MMVSTVAPKPWNMRERLVFGVGLVLIVCSVGGVLGGISSGTGREPGLHNLAVTSSSVLVAAGFGFVGGAIVRFSSRMRRARGVAIDPD